MQELNEQGVPYIEAARFTFRGQIDCESFAAFARHRAVRLDLELELGACNAAAATLSVRGQEALVDAFEMALSLGPYDCVVLEVERRSLGAEIFNRSGL